MRGQAEARRPARTGSTLSLRGEGKCERRSADNTVLPPQGGRIFSSVGAAEDCRDHERSESIVHRTRSAALVAGFLVLAMILGGCMLFPTAEPEEEPAPDEEEAQEEEVQYPLTIVDDAGRQVTIEKRPERVLSFAPSNTEILFSIGAGDRVVGVDDFSNWPQDQTADLPRVGGPMNPNYELIASLEPDLFFTVAGMDDIAERLEDLEITAVVFQPETFEEIYRNVEMAAEIMGMPGEAEAVIDHMQRELEAVEERVSGLSEEDRPRVFYEVWPPLMTAGPGTFIDILITTSGGVNIAGDAGGEWIEFSKEDLIDRDPEVIITTFEDTVAELQEGKRDGWEHLSAVRDDRIYLIDPDLVSRPSPRLIEGLKAMAGMLHPDLFE